MIQLLRRTWRYTAALLVAEVRRPLQIRRSRSSRRSRRASGSTGCLVQQAAAVIGNQRQIELKLGRTMEQVENLRGSARQALVLGDRARGADEESDAASFDEAAHAFALSLVTREAEMRDLKSLHDRAIEGAAAAKEAVEQNAFVLRQRISERTRLLSELEQTKLQERMNEAFGSMSDLAPRVGRALVRTGARHDRAPVLPGDGGCRDRVLGDRGASDQR